MTISITRALVELKTLDSRINKIIDSARWIIYKTKNKNSYDNEEEFKKNVLSEYQSLNDLIIQRDSIKNKILLSNTITKVKINDKEMTVVQAIEYKKTIEYKMALIEQMKSQRQYVIIESEAHKNRLQNKIDENIRIICGKDTKADATAIQSITDGLTKGDPIEIFDPLNTNKLIKDLETECNNFMANIDFVLSESNAITQISV